jgi:transcriptional regulator with XRE-family HTH domain
MSTVKWKRRVDLEAIGRRVREIRGFHLTQGEFARKLELSQQQLSAIENGRSTPTLETLVKLAEFAGTSLDWIVFGD